MSLTNMLSRATASFPEVVPLYRSVINGVVLRQVVLLILRVLVLAVHLRSWRVVALTGTAIACHGD